MTPEEHETRLKRIEQLGDCAGWTEYLRPRISEMLLKTEREALDNEKLTADEVMILRAEARAMRKVLNTAETDQRMSRNALRSPQKVGQS